MTVTPTLYLPPKGRLRLLIPSDRTNRRWLRSVCGAHSAPNLEDEVPRVWTVARHHFAPVMRSAAIRYGEIDVITEHHQSHQCTVACQNARSGPETCECVCAGEHHGGGGGAEWVQVVGDLIVARNVLRRRFTACWDVERQQLAVLSNRAVPA